MHHLKGDALIFCYTYGIESLRVCEWRTMNVFSLHIEPPPPPSREDPITHRMYGYYKHLEDDNIG